MRILRPFVPVYQCHGKRVTGLQLLLLPARQLYLLPRLLLRPQLLIRVVSARMFRSGWRPAKNGVSLRSRPNKLAGNEAIFLR